MVLDHIEYLPFIAGAKSVQSLHPITLLFTSKQKGTLSLFQNKQKKNGLEAMALGSKIQNWILSKLIQFLTVIQIICLIIVGLVNFVTVMNYYGGSGVKRVTMPEASYYLCLYLFWFLKESEYKNYVLASIIFVNVCLMYCIWMEKSSFDYWKMREEKTGRCSLVWLYITGLVSTKSP